MTNREAAERLGVGLETLTCVGWKWRPMLREIGRCVRPPGGGRCNIYAVEGLDRVAAAQAAWQARRVPEGFVDKAGACRMFGIGLHTWKKWMNEGKVRFGERVPGAAGARVMVYRVEDVARLKGELFGEDKLYKDGETGRYHVPADLVTREEACRTFGVNTWVWWRWRWEREGKITCGQQVPGGPKVYRVEDVHRMLDEYGRWSPPYPDPERPPVLTVVGSSASRTATSSARRCGGSSWAWGTAA